MENVVLGLKQNWKQFTLLVIINAFVGGMVGLERSILPEIADKEFGLVVNSAILSFIVVFGITKAITNYYTGALANRIGRKNLLVIGWLFAIPIPVILMYAPNWNWVVLANVLLGINQGLTWSSTVVMKIDLVGEKNRGLAMGLNESAGYLAVGGVAFLTGWIAGEYGLRPYPFYLGIGFTMIGLFTSWLFVKDTRHHVSIETKSKPVPKLANIFWETTWKHPNLGSISQAGLINNLNDGMVWGILPILLTLRGFSLEQIGTVVAIYPAIWGLGQLITGKLADHYDKKMMLFLGMLGQGVALLFMMWAETLTEFILLSVVLGAGTAMVYPTFLAAIAEYTHPEQRAGSIGVFRLWRDLGYAFGAVITGIVADLWGILPSIGTIGILTIISSIIIKLRMKSPVTMIENSLATCISKEETLSLLKTRKVIFVDVRGLQEYQEQHIEGALNISLDQLEDNIQRFKEADLVVTACGSGGGRSMQAAQLLRDHGIDSKWLCRGTFGWVSGK